MGTRTGEVLIHAGEEWHIVHVSGARSPERPTDVAWVDRDGGVVCWLGEEDVTAPLPNLDDLMDRKARADDH
jgi:hypothetical protein